MLYLIKMPAYAIDFFLVEHAIQTLLKASPGPKPNKKICDITDIKALENAIKAYQSPSLLEEEKVVYFFVVSPKMQASVQASLEKWQIKPLKTISLSGVSRAQFLPWVKRYFLENHFDLTAEALGLIEAYCEGHLSAVKQCLEKLALLYGSKEKTLKLSEKDLMDALVYAPQYSLLDFMDHLSPAKIAKVSTMLHYFSASGITPAQVLWALAHHCRKFKKKSVLPALVEADEAIKGLRKENPWVAIERAAWAVAGCNFL